MKAPFKTVRLTAALAFLFCIFSFSSRAQIPGPGPFDIINLTSCDLDIKWVILDGSGNPCMNSGGIISIPAGVTINFTPAMITAMCGTASDIAVGVSGITGGPAFTMGYAFSTATPPYSFTEVDCSGAMYTYSFLYNPTDITIQ